MAMLDAALRLIITRSPRCSAEAAEALRATMTKRERYGSILRHALADPAADWTEADRELLAAATVDDAAADAAQLVIRSVPDDTRRAIADGARARGIPQAEYLRRLLVLREFVAGVVADDTIDAEALRRTVQVMGVL